MGDSDGQCNAKLKEVFRHRKHDVQVSRLDTEYCIQPPNKRSDLEGGNLSEIILAFLRHSS